ncbi:MAG: nickel pincer cofactor biosynthesis protein LarB [Myxococcales bacterium]|nr:nickel pincer cofactor biosynthesis protein LarB [Myxococcales bacterium]
MDPTRLREMLEAVARGERTVGEALGELEHLPFRDLGFAQVDHHRLLRQGFPEVVLGIGKSGEQIAAILVELARSGANLLATRVDPGKFEIVRAALPGARYHVAARAVVVEQQPIVVTGRGTVIVVCAGTSDLPVADEAALTAELGGSKVVRINDVGVAGIHRLLARREELVRASVIVAVAGMEGALPSVVAGLVRCPVIAVPTSIGYGASFGGIAALLGMLSSCAAGVTVVNIDNGFGAGYAAALMNRIVDAGEGAG